MRVQSQEYLWLTFYVLTFTPLLYIAFRHYLLFYGLIWFVMLSIGFIAKKYPRVKLVQFGLFISLVISLLIGMVPR